MKGIIGKKVGMTSVFDPSGKQTACTIIEAGPCVVTQVKTKETDGYSALQLSYGDKKEKRATKAESTIFLNHKLLPNNFLKNSATIPSRKISVKQLPLIFSLKEKLSK